MSDGVSLDELLAKPGSETDGIQLNILAEIPDSGLEFRWIEPQTIAANDLNWKSHPSLQREAYADFLTEVGWVGALLYNQQTKRLLDGHMRLQDALERNLERLPVLTINVPPETENKILALLDRIGSLYATRRQAAERLAEMVQTKSRNLQAILEHRAEERARRLGELEEDDAGNDDLPAPKGLPEGGISLVLGEQYNYITLLFRTELDFNAACDHFGVKKVRCAFNSGQGLGRVVDGSKYLGDILPRLRPSAKKRDSE